MAWLARDPAHALCIGRQLGNTLVPRNCPLTSGFAHDSSVIQEKLRLVHGRGVHPEPEDPAGVGGPDPELLRPDLHVPAGTYGPLELDRLPAEPVFVTGEEPLPPVIDALGVRGDVG